VPIDREIERLRLADPNAIQDQEAGYGGRGPSWAESGSGINFAHVLHRKMNLTKF
jgi:hypothetical protein